MLPAPAPTSARARQASGGSPAATGARPRGGRVASAATRAGAAGRAAGRLAVTSGREPPACSAAVARRQVFASSSFAAADGDRTGLPELHLVDIAGGAALTVSLARTVFAPPGRRARSKVAVFLALTMAPFVLLAR